MPDSAPACPTPEVVAVTTAKPAGGHAPTVFNFAHRVFLLPNARFRLADDGREPVFRVQLGELDVGVPTGTLAREFGIDPSSRDALLIALVRKALRFVAQIRPGDSVPSEILDGTASWPVEERHRACAKAKLMKQLAQWFASDGGGSDELVRLLANSAGNEEFREKVQQVFTRIAEKLGLGAEQRQQVVDHLDTLGRELSYIEAQREHVHKLSDIKKKLLDLARVYVRERTMVEELLRIAGLISDADRGIRGYVSAARRPDRRDHRIAPQCRGAARLHPHHARRIAFPSVVLGRSGRCLARIAPDAEPRDRNQDARAVSFSGQPLRAEKRLALERIPAGEPRCKSADLIQRQHRRAEPRGRDRAGHAPNHARRLVLRDNARAGGDGGPATLQAVLAHARQNDA